MHPNESDLALYAGGDLGWFSRRRVASHAASCTRCQSEIAAFASLRRGVAQESPEISGGDWNRLAMEMRGNIRVGLAAGACVGPVHDTRFLLPRYGLAAAALLLLLASGVWLGRQDAPAPGVVLKANGNSIEMTEGGRALSLMNGQAADVTYSVSAQGGVRARYVDADTGYVTVNHVYVQ